MDFVENYQKEKQGQMFFVATHNKVNMYGFLI